MLDEISLKITEEKEVSVKTSSKIEASGVSNPVLARLIEEVRNEEAYSINSYNRMHNRHNRSR